MKERLQKVLANAGVASRRKCEDLIRQKRVVVNGVVAKIGDSVSVDDKIVVDNKPLKFEKKVYFMLNKPKGFVTTVSEQHGMKTIFDLVKVKERVFPVGRLDKDSEGLVLLTNDGALANKLMHPRFGVEKEYFVVLDDSVSKKVLENLKLGVVVDGRRVVFSKLSVNGKEVLLRVHEGRKHIIRRLFDLLGLTVVCLVRTRLASLSLGSLEPGKYRKLSDKEVSELLKLV